MITRGPNRLFPLLIAAMWMLGCAGDSPADESQGAIIDPPAQCSPGRPDCSSSSDFPDHGDLNEDNSAGVRFSDETGALVIDRVSQLPDADRDGVPDDADDCPETPDWISCDNDPSNDGLYATIFYDPEGSGEVIRRTVASTTAEIPQLDVYFLIDATPTLADEIAALQADISNIIAAVRLEFGDVRFGLGIYRAYPLSPLAAPYSQSPYHHILDLTDDDSLVEAAIGTLDTVANAALPTALTQALFATASGSGLGDMVANRGSCPDAGVADVGYPCFRPDALHMIMNISDSEVYNGPRLDGPSYADPPFAPGVGAAATTLPPVEMFPGLLDADDAASALDLGDLSTRSLTLLGMSNRLSNQVQTSIAPGCAPPPPPDPPPIPADPPEEPPGADMDDKDVVLAFRFDSTIANVNVFANNTHWPGANVALFGDSLLDPSNAFDCDGGTAGVGMWGSIAFSPMAAQQYYLVADGIVPAADPGLTPEGAFSISIVHDGDPANPTWLTADAPVTWTDVETALLASDIRVASVLALRDAASVPSDGSADARLIAAATRALTKADEEWVTELASSTGQGLAAAVSSTIRLARTDSVYDISATAVDDGMGPIDERDFVFSIRWQDCSQTEPTSCGWGAGARCRRCDPGAAVDFEVLFANRTVPPTETSQVFDFELVIRADEAVEVERIPVRVLIPDAAAHDFDDTDGTSFYRNTYDTTSRCITPPERPKWSDFTWEGDTPEGTAIEFQIRTAPTESDLSTAIPAIVEVPTDTESRVFDLTEELIADGLTYGLPYIQITAVFKPSLDPPATPSLEGWSFEFFCEAAE
jgi:hypothetical protein